MRVVEQASSHNEHWLMTREKRRQILERAKSDVQPATGSRQRYFAGR